MCKNCYKHWQFNMHVGTCGLMWQIKDAYLLRKLISCKRRNIIYCNSHHLWSQRLYSPKPNVIIETIYKTGSIIKDNRVKTKLINQTIDKAKLIRYWFGKGVASEAPHVFEHHSHVDIYGKKY